MISSPFYTLLHAAQVVGFVPTGWMYEMRRAAFPVRHKGACHVHLVPYSEHSSYEELREYVRFLKPHQVSHEATPTCSFLSFHAVHKPCP